MQEEERIGLLIACLPAKVQGGFYTTDVGREA